jgi:hypothetical protein
VTIRAGWIAQAAMPSASKVDAFVSGWSVNLSANGVSKTPSVAYNWGATGHSLSDFSQELGVTMLAETPGISLTGSWSEEITDKTTSWTF